MPAVVAGAAAAFSGLAAGAGLSAGVLFAVNVGIALVATAATRALGDRPSRYAVPADSGRRVTAQGTVESRRVLYGAPRVAGHLVFFGTSGSDNRYLWFVTRWADHVLDAFVTLHLDGTDIDVAGAIDGSGYVTLSKYQRAGTSRVRVYNRDGSQVSAIADLNSAFTEITSSYVGFDVAHTAWRFEIDDSAGGTNPASPDSNVWADGAPRLLEATVQGRQCYDLRDTSTAWTRNAALALYDYLVDCPYGPQVPASAIDASSWSAAATVCDEAVTVWALPGPGITTQPRYTVDAVLYTADSQGNPRHAENVEALLQAMAGTLVWQGGKLYLYAGAWEAASDTLTEADLAGAVSMPLTESSLERVNGVRGTFWDLARSGELVEFLARQDASYIAEDNGLELWADLELSAVGDHQQAQRLALLRLKQSRNQATFQAVCKLSALRYRLHQVLAVTLDELGEAAGTYRVAEMTVNHDGTVTVTCRQDSAAAYAYVAPEDPPTGAEEIDKPGTAPSTLATLAAPPPISGMIAEPGMNSVLLRWTNPVWPWPFTVEIYRTATASVPTSTTQIRARVKGEAAAIEITPGTVNYWWALVRDDYSQLTSTFYPTSGGVTGDPANVDETWQLPRQTAHAEDLTDTEYGGYSAGSGQRTLLGVDLDMLNGNTRGRIDVRLEVIGAATSQPDWTAGITLSVYRVEVDNGSNAVLLFREKSVAGTRIAGDDNANLAWRTWTVSIEDLRAGESYSEYTYELRAEPPATMPAGASSGYVRNLTLDVAELED